VNKEYGEMLARLCRMKEAWCLPTSGPFARGR
jgi:hypothetical protein